MMEKEWRPVVTPGFEDLYEVSNHGEVRRGPQGRILKGGLHPKGYLGVVFSGRGQRKGLLIHRIVLEAFVGLRPPGLEARHRDGDPTNNRLDNLHWGTSADNEHDKRRHGTVAQGERNGQTKLTELQVREIVRRYANGESQRALAVAFGVRQPQISRIVTGRRWNHLEPDEPTETS
jgi:hypothetical protein